ncbi:MAG TPA: hypothetical protein VHJ76_02220 [Actinomycetota bacterium]|nr:hypothetical protein [Actinomycetota bacterium]
MRKIVMLVAAAALVASGLNATPAAAQGEVTVPDVVNIEDPYGDANTQPGDQQYPTDVSTVADLGKVWFTHDATNFNIHILTEGPPQAQSPAFQFVVTAGPEGCAVFSGYYNGVTYLSDAFSRLVDNCNAQDPLDGTFTFGEGPDGQGLATMTLPREGAPFLTDGSSITAPFAQSWAFAGGEQLTPSGYRGVRNRIDDTKPGTDYVLSGGGTVEPPKPPMAPKPGKGKPKGCDKGKGKKKGCKPAPPAACATFAPGELGKDKPTIVVTDAATEAAPVEQKVSVDMSLGDLGFGLVSSGPFAESADYFNVQVDSANPDAGLYASIEFAERRDYDLDLLHPDGSYAARSHDWNTVLGTGEGENGGHAGEATTASEKIVGVRTADCGGWTVETTNWLGEGGELTVKLWLGEAQNDPLPAGEEPRG